MTIIITLLLCVCSVQHVAVHQSEDSTRSQFLLSKTRSEDSLLENAGYPKAGDIPMLNRKIFKGQRVSIKEHPYIASVRRMNTHYLTAVLLTRNLVISIAHPLAKVPTTELGVVLGENYSDRGTLIMTVLFVIFHSDFDPYTLRADIALIRLYEQAGFRSSVKSIPLVPPTDSLEGKKAFVVGWGRCDSVGMELCLARSSRYFPDEKMDPMLRSTTFIISCTNYYCEGYKRHDVNILPGMMCMGVAREEDPVSPCLGAPGAPLVTKASLAGLLSWGFGCAYSFDLPLVYTDIQYYSSWILKNIMLLHKMKQNNFTALFQGTKAAILSQWLIETRVIAPKLNIRANKKLAPLEIDNVLSRLDGSVYDFRDYILDGVFNQQKTDIYENFKIKNRQKEIIFKHALKSEPFLSNETLLDSEFNMSGIETVSDNITDSSTETSDIEKDILSDDSEESDSENDYNEKYKLNFLNVENVPTGYNT